MTRAALLLVLLAGLAWQGCSEPDRKKAAPAPAPAPVVTPVSWTLDTDPSSAYAECEQEITQIVVAFDAQITPVDHAVHYSGTPGWRNCGSIRTVGCNTAPGLIEFATWDDQYGHYTLRELVRWVVVHDLIHEFHAALGNPYGPDGEHLDPRWRGEWHDAWLVPQGGATL